MMHNIRTMHVATLEYAKRDLLAVIAVQEKTVRDGGVCPKLGEYYDDLSDVRTELARRAKGRM